MLRIGLVGLGKIARDQHLPAIAANPATELAAVASRNAHADGVACYPDLATLLDHAPHIDAIVLCQPPQVRLEAAVAALKAGKHVFLEKPPGISVAEVETLVALARSNPVTLYASWHSRFGSGIAPTRDWLHGKRVRRITILWKEDVRHWHPGQDWVWDEGGFGVFDPGINALSILTALTRDPVVLVDATVEIPANRAMPIAAQLEMTAGTARISAVFDWRQTGPQLWDIEIETDAGTARLGDGGNSLSIDGMAQRIAPASEYPALYAHFVNLVRTGASDVDLAPLQLAEDAFAIGQRIAAPPFHW